MTSIVSAWLSAVREFLGQIEQKTANRHQVARPADGTSGAAVSSAGGTSGSGGASGSFAAFLASRAFTWRGELSGREFRNGGVDLAGTGEQVRVRDIGVHFERPLHKLT